MSLPYTGKQRQDTAIKVKQLQSEEHLCQRKLQLLRKRLTDLEQNTVQGSTVVNTAASLHAQQPFSVVGGSTGREGAGALQGTQQKEVVRAGVQGQGQGQGLVQAQGQQSAGLVQQKRGVVPSIGNSNLGNAVPSRSEPAPQSVGGGMVGKEKERERDKRQQIPWQMCSTILKNLMKHKDVAPFAKPVDPVEAGAPDYYEVVSRPMDLGTVMENLKSPRQYKSPLAFRDDVRQVWKNCRLYNPPGTWIRVTGEKLSDQFEKNWVQKGVEERWFQETGCIDNSAISSKMIEMSKEYHQKVDNMRKVVNKSGRREATEFEERRKLSQQITQLPGEKLIQVLDLIIDLESEHNFEGDQEVVLDICELKVNTVESLKNFVKRLMANSNNVQKNYNNVNSTQNGDVGQPAPRPPTMPNRQQTQQQREQMQKQATERSLKQQQQVHHSTIRTNTAQAQQQSYTQKGQEQIANTNNFSNTNGSQFHQQNGHSNSESEQGNNSNSKDQKDVRFIVDQLIDDSVQQYNERDQNFNVSKQQQQQRSMSDNNTNSSNKRQSPMQDQQQQQQQDNMQQQSNKRQKNTPSEEDDENEEESNEQDNRSHGTEEDMWEDFKSRDERIREQEQQEGQSQQQQQQQQQFVPQYDDGIKENENKAGSTEDMDVDGEDPEEI